MNKEFYEERIHLILFEIEKLADELYQEETRPKTYVLKNMIRQQILTDLCVKN